MGSSGAQASESVQAIKAQLESSVLAKVRQVQPVPFDASGLAASVEQSILAKIQPQLQETSSCAQTALVKVQHLEGTVASVATKVDQQERSLRDLFTEQMARIRSCWAVSGNARND